MYTSNEREGIFGSLYDNETNEQTILTLGMGINTEKSNRTEPN